MSKAYVPVKSQSQFYIPPTLESDFDNFLDNDIPGHVMDFTLLTNWYDKFEETYEPTVIRGEIYPDSTKSRYEDTDNNLNFRASVSSGIKKGDMLVDPDGDIYVLDWEVHREHNNLPSRAVRCNFKLTVVRRLNNPVNSSNEEMIDDYGYVIETAQEEDYSDTKTIVDACPCNAYRYDGRPEYSTVSNAPGVIPNALTIITIQKNDQTKNIKVDDEFIWGDQEYVVIDINYVGINLSTDTGTLKIQAKKKTGGYNG